MSVFLPRGEIEGTVKALADGDVKTADCGWVRVEAEEQFVRENVYNLYPEPDRVGAGILSAHSDQRGMGVTVFDTKDMTPTFMSQHDLPFVYPLFDNLRSFDFLAQCHFWVGATSQTGGYLQAKKAYAIIIPNLGKISLCDLTKTRIIELPLKDARSRLLELSRELSPIASSSAPPPTSSPSPQ